MALSTLEDVFCPRPCLRMPLILFSSAAETADKHGEGSKDMQTILSRIDLVAIAAVRSVLKPLRRVGVQTGNNLGP